MQKIISKALNEERDRLSILAQKHITKDVEKTLEALLKQEDHSYILTLLKKEPKDFSCKQISHEINKQKVLKPVYNFSNDFLPTLEISDIMHL